MRKKSSLLFALIFTFIAGIFFTVSCDKDSGTNNGNGAGGTFWPPQVGFTAEYWIWDAANDSFPGWATVIEQDGQTFPGKTYTKIQVGDFSGNQKHGFIIWLDMSTYRKIGYKASEVYYPPQGVAKTGSTSTEGFFFKEVLDPPLYIIFDGQVGQRFTSTSSMVMTFNDGSTESSTISVESTLKSLLASVETPMGNITQAIKVASDFTLTYADSSAAKRIGKVTGSDTFSGEYYFHKEYGLAWADMIPGFMKMAIKSEPGN